MLHDAGPSGDSLDLTPGAHMCLRTPEGDARGDAELPGLEDSAD